MSHPFFMRTLIDYDPFAELPDLLPSWAAGGAWPCRWIGASESAPFVAAFRCPFHVESDGAVRAHVSADERYELFLDGVRIGRGSERGDTRHWCFETYDIPLKKGAHVLVAKVWALGEFAPLAQLSLRPGFLFAPEEAAWISLLGTGVADWQVQPLDGFRFVRVPEVEGVGGKLVLDGSRFPWGFEFGTGEGWMPATALEPGMSVGRVNNYGAVHQLTPAKLPPMLEFPRALGVVKLVANLASTDSADVPISTSDHLVEEAAEWDRLIRGEARQTIPAGTIRRIVLDLEDYVCGYPALVTSGGRGSVVKILWTEALRDGNGVKGHRDEIEGKLFKGSGPVFHPGGGAHENFEALWWEAGRFIEIVVGTDTEELVIESLTLRETRYPLEIESTFEADDARLTRITPILVRSLQMCLHETYMDCPYYEQLMYAGDTRTEVLTTYVLTRDDRPPRKALALFASSRLPSGLTQSRYPSRVTQIIPPFALWWVAMVYDFALWRDDAGFVKSLMPPARSVIDSYIHAINEDGLVQSPGGWNYMDWVDGWPCGVPPDGNAVSGIINLQFVLVLTLVGKLEAYCGRPELAAQALRVAAELQRRIEAVFWNEELGLFSDDAAGQRFSEHAQALAVLGGFIDSEKRRRIAEGLAAPNNLARASIYFTHYLFEAFCALGNMRAVQDRFGFWFNLERNGFKTTPETADPCRSECHAWGAHPLYHFFASILGIRPASMGFESVRIAPQLGSLGHAQGRFAHPLGDIEVEFDQDAREIRGTIVLPRGLSGHFICGATSLPLHEGRQTVRASLEN